MAKASFALATDACLGFLLPLLGIQAELGHGILIQIRLTVERPTNLQEMIQSLDGGDSDLQKSTSISERFVKSLALSHHNTCAFQHT